MNAGSRFWWRALDAHSPLEPLAQRPLDQPPRFVPAQARQQQTNPFSLEIPRSDLRRARTRAKSRRKPIVALSISLCLGAAVAAAAFIGTESRNKYEEIIGGKAQSALLALGFGLDQINLSGHQFTSDRDVYEALNLEAARTLASFDAAAALKRIEGLPWVETAEISRVFPGTLNVVVKERQPTALWSRAGKTYLIDPTGRVLGVAGEPQSWRLPRIAGEGASSEAALLFAALERHPEIAHEVALAERVGTRRWSLVLKNATRLELGADREIEGLDQIAKNSQLRTALTGAPFIVDVRTPGRIVMRPAAQPNVSDAGGSPMNLAGAAP